MLYTAEVSSEPKVTALGRAAAIWGLIGVVAFLGRAVVGLAPLAIEPVVEGMTPLQWVCYVGFIGFMGYTEGYRGFQKGFSPRVVVRAEWIAKYGREVPWTLPLAPVVCMGWIFASKRRLIGSWAVTLGVVGLVMLVRQLSQPWRGIVDGGVVVGLTWGMISVVVFAIKALNGNPPDKDPQMPKGAPGQPEPAEPAAPAEADAQ